MCILLCQTQDSTHNAAVVVFMMKACMLLVIINQNFNKQKCLHLYIL